jgi:hypothetical protein
MAAGDCPFACRAISARLNSKGLRQLADAYIGFAARNEIDDCIEGVGVFNERHPDAESLCDLLRQLDLGANQRAVRPLSVEARQVKSGNGHAQNLGSNDRLQVARGGRLR